MRKMDSRKKDPSQSKKGWPSAEKSRLYEGGREKRRRGISPDKTQVQDFLTAEREEEVQGNATTTKPGESLSKRLGKSE